MKNIKTYLLCILITMLFCFALACKKDEPTETEASSICFTVDGFVVTVHNVWSGGQTHTVNVQGLASFDEEVSMGGETHTLEWTNIVNDYGSGVVVSFDVKIDGNDYSYPADKCG